MQIIKDQCFVSKRYSWLKMIETKGGLTHAEKTTLEVVRGRCWHSQTILFSQCMLVAVSDSFHSGLYQRPRFRSTIATRSDGTVRANCRSYKRHVDWRMGGNGQSSSAYHEELPYEVFLRTTYDILRYFWFLQDSDIQSGGPRIFFLEKVLSFFSDILY